MADPTGVLYADTSALVKPAVEEPETRALRSDAIHVATAASLGADLTGLLTYDVRMQQAGSGLGFAVVAPR